MANYPLKNEIIGHSKNQFLKTYKQGILEVNVEYDLLISTKLFELRL